MKKFLGILAIAGTLVACNNSADSAENKTDSIDSVADVKTDVIDSVADAKKDAIDSTADAKIDSIKK